MIAACLREENFAYEADLATWWHSTIGGHDLVAVDGRSVRILFAGRPGGGAGPDFRDAVVIIDGVRHCGDVELHLRSSGWYSHGHDRDPRYDRVILHVVAGGPVPLAGNSIAASGKSIPILLVGALTMPVMSVPAWPCQHLPHTPAAIIAWLQTAGKQRFGQRIARFATELATSDDADRVLIGAIAEALGYGRQPLLTRAAGMALGTGQSWEQLPLDHLSRRRIQQLAKRLPSWQQGAVMAWWCGQLLAGGIAHGWQRLLAALAEEEVPPQRRTIGDQRAAIVLWNAILPCLAAFGARQENQALAAIAQQAAYSAPSLPHNTITRFMARWIGLRTAPAGALAQQGLQHLHTQWCRTKICATCPLGTTLRP